MMKKDKKKGKKNKKQVEKTIRIIGTNEDFDTVKMRESITKDHAYDDQIEEIEEWECERV